MKSSIFFKLSLLFTTVLALTGAWAQGTTMQLNSNEIHQDETAELTIQTSGTSASPISPPVVPGLEFSAVDQSTQIQDINGAMTSTSSVTYEITPQGPGLYTIPTHDPASKSLTLRVLPGNAPANNASPSLPPPAVSWGVNPRSQANVHGSAFLKTILPKTQLYVGEKVPIEIQMGLPADSQPTLQGLPTPTADAFLLDKLSEKPDQAEQTINGQPYLIVTWKSTLAAMKPGEFPLSMSTPVSLQVPVAAPRLDDSDDQNSLFQDPFQNPVFQNFFGRSVKKELTLTSTPETVSVLPVPTSGQPVGYSGAVGKFTMEASIDPQSGAVGDPLTLHVAIKGSGSFDRVSTSLLRNVNGWKTYPPTSKFVPADSVGYSGEKDYDQAVIPMTAGEETLPSPEFSFFNPDSHQYETIHASVPTVHVLPNTPPTRPGHYANRLSRNIGFAANYCRRWLAS